MSYETLSQICFLLVSSNCSSVWIFIARSLRERVMIVPFLLFYRQNMRRSVWHRNDISSDCMLISNPAALAIIDTYLHFNLPVVAVAESTAFALIQERNQTILLSYSS